MTRAFLTQTTFTAGELDPRMRGRTELRSFENGAAKLRNVIVEPTGGVRRRPGLRHVATAEGQGRLVGVETGPDQAYVLAFSDFRVDVWRDGVHKTNLPTPWSVDQIAQIAWAQRGTTLIVTHPSVPPQVITREDDTVWTIDELAFAETDAGLAREPFSRFTAPDVTLEADGTTGTVNLTASAPVFVADHLGGIVRIKRKQIELSNIVSSTEAVGLVLEDLTDPGPTTEWDELAFSDARGWPATVSFQQNRMVFGGSRDLPNGLWMSRTGRPFDFDLGTGLDDEGIEFRLLANDTPAIRGLLSGRHLQVFTSSGEWVVTGDPLTPTNIQVQQQSAVGSPRDRHVPPRDVDGATLFAARNGRELREFLFTNLEQAYQAADLALLSAHLVIDPVDQVFDRRRRLFMIVMADGSLATIAIDRNADIVAWSLQETDGRFLSATVAGGKTHLLVERANGVFVETVDEELMVDAGLRLSEPDGTTVWDGLDHLEGQEVAVVADDFVVERAVVSDGAITLSEPARELIVGLPYAHVIEPLPAVTASGRRQPQDSAYRPVRVNLRLFDTRSLWLDTGDGLREVPLHKVGEGPTDRSPSPFSGDRAVRALGWRRGLEQPPWRIEQDTPLPFFLLSATTEVKVND